MAGLGLCFLALAAHGQTWRGTVSGAVVDEARRAIPGAAVSATHQATGRKRAASTNSQGEFAIPFLSPGQYTIEVEREGFGRHAQDVVLAVNHEVNLEIGLRPGQLREQVVVTATRDLLKTDSASVSTVVGNRLINNLPLDGRNFYELTLLTPGLLLRLRAQPDRCEAILR